jgi:hypothetical protein
MLRETADKRSLVTVQSHSATRIDLITSTTTLLQPNCRHTAIYEFAQGLCGLHTMIQSKYVETLTRVILVSEPCLTTVLHLELATAALPPSHDTRRTLHTMPLCILPAVLGRLVSGTNLPCRKVTANHFRSSMQRDAPPLPLPPWTYLSSSNA